MIGPTRAQDRPVVRLSKKTVLLALTAMAVGMGFLMVPHPATAEMCKWVDENGCVHYAQTCPEGVEGEQVDLQAPPGPEQVRAAEQRAAEATRRLQTQEPAEGPAGASLPLHDLGPLPDNVTSKYLTTLGTGITCNFKDLEAQFMLRLKANSGLPRGAWVEARFPDPAGRGNLQVTGMTPERPGAEMLFLSPPSRGFKCMNYQIEALVFDDESKQALLGTHRQTIQSRLDMSKVRTREDLLKAMTGKSCPDQFSGKSVAELESLCEEAREWYLKPLREKEIDRCIHEQGKDPEYCRTFFSTYGDGGIRGGYVMARMFDDLPECVAAREARNAQQ